jgi:chemotaxis protein MotB
MARRKKTEEDSGLPGWMVTFSDLILLLVTFFVLLNSYSDMERGKMIEIARSFKGAVAMLPGGLSIEVGKELTMFSPDQTVMGRMTTKEELIRSLQDLMAQFQETGLRDYVIVKDSEEGVEFQVKDALLFDPGSATLRPESYPVLDIIAGTIRKSQVLAVVEGHTDNQPIHTPVFPSNWELSAMRAAAVMQYIEHYFRVPAYRLEAKGYGDSRPIADNSTPEGRMENRRVVVRLTALPQGRHGEE